MKNNQAEIIKKISDRELSFHLYATQVVLLTISFLLGIFLFEDMDTFTNQFNLNFRTALIGLGFGLIVVILDIILMKKLPENLYDDGGINQRIFSRRNPGEIALLSLLIALSEEILFRGIIQFHFGFLIASVIFAIVHIRYWRNGFLIINIVVLSLLIGFVYEWTSSLSATIIMHFTIDFLLGCHIRIQSVKKSRDGS
ncbi:membrane protease YdiL (CAAX protease family) [Bacillus pakistanensis]|uniref:Membrane protease YdiL (CAAX protease family) n=1 Tax=Rossellomorea pakistanensis TaxID=992288 RepID=A0ABS2N958_9BACI|nr:type II CAAX endopeptidase family protein [Bacillus pakistanensis]MBM7584388.1 membrane protease YdiL (CAAX protease family) [Bacillus pakistanensis]